jgi:hypothetical protein
LTSWGKLVVKAGMPKAQLEDTDEDGILDIDDPDDDNDGVPDTQESEPESKPVVTGQPGTGKPDWWCKKNPGKC